MGATLWLAVDPHRLQAPAVSWSTTHNLSTLLQRSAARFPRLPAIAVGEGVCHRYDKLAQRVATLAATLRDSGLLPGERIAGH